MTEGATIRLVLIHPFDPRGLKVGGIETHVRQVIRHAPADMRVLLVGVDDSGKLATGRLHRLEWEGISFDFFPLLHASAQEQRGAAQRLGQSLTLRFALALARHLPALRRAVGPGPAVAEIERLEFAALARAMGLPLVAISHNEGDPRVDAMDSLLSRYWLANLALEHLAVRLAGRLFGVTQKIRDRLASRSPSAAARSEVLTVSVDTDLFCAHPFDLADGVLRVVYAGRLDAFKAPETMFATIAELARLLDGRIEFHYCGSGDPTGFASFAPIARFTHTHGSLSSAQVAAVMERAHIGILTSHYEGMPCFLLELLASGRPFGGVRLPQFAPLVEEGVSGRTTERAAGEEATAQAAAQAIARLWGDIQEGRIDPQAVHAKVLPWSTQSQLQRLFAAHRALATRQERPARPMARAGAEAPGRK